MKNSFKSILSKEIKNSLFQLNFVKSVTIVGSFNDKNKNLMNVGDIDVVIILDEFNEKKFQICNAEIKKLNQLISQNTGLKLKINSTFGPIKFYSKKNIIIHLMIYDIKSHKQHVIESPFTCYDWERSDNFVGMKLSNVSPVYNIFKQDLYNSKRNYLDYLKDISKSRISFKKYKFTKNNYYLKKDYLDLDKKNKIEFSFHIIKNLIINFLKFYKDKNYLPNNKEILKTFSNICKADIELKKNFIELINAKNNRKNKLSFNEIEFCKKFIFYYLKNLEKCFNKSSYFCFIRHNKTKYNDGSFFGQKRDSKIIDTNKNKELLKFTFSKCFVSKTKRASQTARLYIKNKNIIIDNNLNEINYGLAEGLNIQQLETQFPKILSSWRLKKDPYFPKGENTKDVLNRLNIFLNKILKEENKIDNDVLIVTHNVLLRCLIGKFLKLEIYDWYKIKINFKKVYKFYTLNSKLRYDFNRNKNNNIFIKKI